MILKRKIYDKLLTLKTELNGKKILLIECARHIGKSLRYATLRSTVS